MVDTLYDLCLKSILFVYPNIEEMNLLPEFYKDNLFELFNRTIRYKILKVKHNTLQGCFLFKVTPYREISDMISFMYKVNNWAPRLGCLETSWNKYASDDETSRAYQRYSSFQKGLSLDYF